MNERSRELIGYIDVNPRIRELAIQAGCKIDKLGYGEGNLEKFAELIVGECVQILDDFGVEQSQKNEQPAHHRSGFGGEEDRFFGALKVQRSRKPSHHKRACGTDRCRLCGGGDAKQHIQGVRKCGQGKP